MRVLPADVRRVREGDSAVPGLGEEAVPYIYWLTPICVWRERRRRVGGEKVR